MFWALFLLSPSQVNLSNPLTIPVTFRTETRGAFVIKTTGPQPRPQRERTQEKGTLGPAVFDEHVAVGAQSRSKQAWGAETATPERVASAAAAVPSPRQDAPRVQGKGLHSTRQHEECGECIRGGEEQGTGKGTTSPSQTVKLLPGQNLQLEIVFLPSKEGPHAAAALRSSFTPGSEVIVE